MNSFEQLGILRELEPSGYSSKIGVCVLLFLGSTELGPCYFSGFLFQKIQPQDGEARHSLQRIVKRWSEPDGHQSYE